MRQFIRFALAGGVATSVHFAILVALVRRGHAPVVASSVGAICGALTNYWLNRRFTFHSRRSHWEALPRYLVTAIGGFLFNGVVVGAMVAMNAHYLVAQTTATGVVLLWGFFVNRWWTFRGEGYAQ